jgi:hypothetical protein
MYLAVGFAGWLFFAGATCFGILPFLGLKTDQTHREWALSPFSPGLFPDEVKQAHLRLFSDEWMKLGEPYGRATERR